MLWEPSRHQQLLFAATSDARMARSQPWAQFRDTKRRDSLQAAEVSRPVRPVVAGPAAMVWGVKLPWNLVATAALGFWLMFTPSALASAGLAAHSDHLIGALIVTASVIALADVGRVARYINIAFGAWVIVSPWLLDGATGSAKWSDVIVGGLVLLLSFRRGPIGDRYTP